MWFYSLKNVSSKGHKHTQNKAEDIHSLAQHRSLLVPNKWHSLGEKPVKFHQVLSKNKSFPSSPTLNG